jgi:hypothetical protein
MKALTLLVALSATLCTALFASDARAAQQPAIGPEPAWVMPAAMPAAPLVTHQGLRVLLHDQQVRFHAATTSVYQRRILRIDGEQGLEAMRHLALQWRSVSDQLTIHRFTLTRGGREHDLLAAVRAVLDEQQIRPSALRMDGEQTLGLPIGGLAVGDRVEVAYSIDRVEPVLGGHREMALDAGTSGGIDWLSIRAQWDEDAPMRLAGRNLPAGLQRAPGQAWLTAGPISPSPAARSLEISDFATWGDVAEIFVPLFDQARQTAPNSPLREQAARIAAATPNPARRAAMAVELVREEVKYLYVGLGEGNLRPMDADKVWQRGFGDCKGKVALLLALLDQLGIAAQPALVATRDGDGLDRRLPALGGFDHVIVRAQIGGQVVWLDPTREARQRYVWALPVRMGAGLEAIGPLRAAAAETGTAKP